MSKSPESVVLDMTDLVLDRLEAWRSGDQKSVARLDAGMPRDPVSMAALWSAAFGIAERTLNVLDDRDPGAAAELIADFRGQVDEARS